MRRSLHCLYQVQRLPRAMTIPATTTIIPSSILFHRRLAKRLLKTSKSYRFYSAISLCPSIPHVRRLFKWIAPAPRIPLTPRLGGAALRNGSARRRPHQLPLRFLWLLQVPLYRQRKKKRKRGIFWGNCTRAYAHRHCLFKYRKLATNQATTAAPEDSTTPITVSVAPAIATPVVDAATTSAATPALATDTALGATEEPPAKKARV